MRNNVHIIIMAIAASLVASVWASDVTAPAGSARNLAASDFMPHSSNAKDFNENWSYQFVFDNGTRAFINYSSLNVPGSGRKIGCDMTLWNFKGKTHTVGRQYPSERLKANKEKSTIDIKGEYMMENKPGKGHHVLFSADKDGKFFLDLTFDSAEQGKVLGDGVWKVGGEKFAQYIHIPYGRVSGRIGYNEDTISVKGYAYMDQTWQTVQPTEIAARSLNFSTNARSPLYAGRISITPKGGLLGYVLYNGGEGSKVVLPASIKEDGEKYSGKKFPKKELSIEWKDGSPALSFPVGKTYQKASLLDKIDGWFAKKAMKIAAGGEVMFYRGRSDASHGKKLDWTVTGVKD